MRRIFIQFHELIDANISQRIAEQKELLRNTPPKKQKSASTCVHLHAYTYTRTGFRGLGATKKDVAQNKTQSSQHLHGLVCGLSVLGLGL